ncbi:hypothetical protein RF11_12355 [Thelohanellus kitauei]|uniref:Uncharacterized protein n=1 Tax=Thelohanellus kitauei TaxID=669202 RepID=A0A0C2JU17_THEKT|nr:hypothetical protein RF11_12355 [Thelohanellus kitauei]
MYFHNGQCEVTQNIKGPDHDARERPLGNIPYTYSPFLIQIGNLLQKWKNIVMPESPRSQTDEFIQVAKYTFRLREKNLCKVKLNEEMVVLTTRKTLGTRKSREN